MRNLVAAAVLGGAFALTGNAGLTLDAARAQQAPSGALVAQTCSGCHGADYKGSGGMPLLRGRPAEELATQMAEFRANQRYSTVMGRLARGLTDDEIRAVSAYLAGLR